MPIMKSNLTNDMVKQRVNEIHPRIKDMPIKELFNDVDYPAILLCASRRTGKTHTLHHLLRESKKKYDHVKLISSTHEHNEGYPYLQDVDKHHTSEMSKIVEEFSQLNSDRRKQGKKMESVMLLLDDILDDPIIAKRSGNNPLIKLTTLGRHLGIGFCCLTQYFKALPRVCRGNFDMCLLSRTGNLQDAQSFIEEYLSGDQEGLLQKGGRSRIPIDLYYKIVSEDFTWLCVHTTKQNKKGYADYVYKVSAPSKLKKFNPYKIRKENTSRPDKNSFVNMFRQEDYNIDEDSALTNIPEKRFNKRLMKIMMKK